MSARERQVDRINDDGTVYYILSPHGALLLQAVKICAEAGTPLPAETVIRLMEGFRTKTSVLRAIEQNRPAQ